MKNKKNIQNLQKDLNRNGTKHSRYRIVESEGNPHGDVYELEINYYYDVIDNSTGKSIMQFGGVYSASLGDSGNWENGRYSGVDKVEITDDEKYVVVYYSSGKKSDRIKLPE